MMVDGTNLPTSMVLMVFRDTPIASARSAWLSRCSARKTLILFSSSLVIDAARSCVQQEEDTEQQQHERQDTLDDDFQRHQRQPREYKVGQCLQYGQDDEAQHPRLRHGFLKAHLQKPVLCQARSEER